MEKRSEQQALLHLLLAKEEIAPDSCICNLSLTEIQEQKNVCTGKKLSGGGGQKG